MNPFSSQSPADTSAAPVGDKRMHARVKQDALPRYRRPIRNDYKHWLHYHLPDMDPADIATMEEIETIL